MFRLLAIFVVCGWTYASPSLRHRRQAAIDNPCLAATITDGNNYFAYPGDDTQFIECDLAGHMNVLSCPDGTVWSEQQLACVYKFEAQVGGGSIGGAQSGGSLGFPNPCTGDHLSSGILFYPYPGDDTRFLQCDLWGDVFVLSCPPNLHWNMKYTTCIPLNYQPPSSTPA